MMGSSEPGLGSKLGAVFQKCFSSLPLTYPGFIIPRDEIMSLLLGFAIAASFPVTDTSNTLGSAGLNSPSRRTVCITAWTCHRARPCSKPHSKLAAFQVTQYKGIAVECVSSRTPKS